MTLLTAKVCAHASKRPDLPLKLRNQSASIGSSAIPIDEIKAASPLKCRRIELLPWTAYTTIKGVLADLGHTVARETVQNILKEPSGGTSPETWQPRRHPYS